MNKFFIIAEKNKQSMNEKYLETFIPLDYKDGISFDHDIRYWHSLYFGMFLLDYFKLPKKVCVDVGTHKGLYASVYARHFSKVHAFEPSPPLHTVANLNFIRQNIPNITLHKTALLDESIECKFYTHYLDDKKTDISGSNSALINYSSNPQIKKTDVSTIISKTLDSYNLDIDFIKIDAEGNEYKVLKGAEGTILKSKPAIQVELAGVSDLEPLIHDYLISLGYEKVNLKEFSYIHPLLTNIDNEFYLQKETLNGS